MKRNVILIKTASGENRVLKFTDKAQVEVKEPFMFVYEDEALSHVINLAECETISFE